MEWIIVTLAAAGFCAFVIYWFDTYQDLHSWRQDTELLAHALDYVTQRFQAAISLMLGFYTITLYNRWWSVRGKMQSVSSSIKDIALQLAMTRAVEQFEEQVKQVDCGQNEKSPSNKSQSISTLSPPSPPNKAESTTPGKKPKRRNTPPPTPTKSTILYRNTAKHVRLTMVRWVNLAHALAVRDLFEQNPNEFSVMERLQNMGLITDEEIIHLQSSLPLHYRDSRSSIFKRRDPHRQYDIPIAWVYEWIYQLDQSDHFMLAPILLSILNSSLVNIRENLDALFMYRDTPVPLFYRQLVTITIRLYMIIFLIGDGLMALQHVTDIAMADEFDVNIERGAATIEGFSHPDLSALLKTAYYMLIPFTFEYFVFVG
jgi:hypothetical protein